MRVLLATAEAVPFVKVGGLADVTTSVAKSLAQLGHDIKLVLPLYSTIDRSKLTYYDQPMIINMGYGVEFCRLWSCVMFDVEFLFVEFEKYFGRSGIYGKNGIGYEDNWARFGFLSRAIIDMCDFINWTPEVIHANDWHTGLLPVMLREQTMHRLNKTASVFTIHNMAHHGYSPRQILNFVGLPDRIFNPFSLEAYGSVNIMKGALLYADKITTVSPTYAEEIKTAEYGCGLDNILRYRAADLIGICNAVDTSIWSPEHDAFIPKNFSHENLSGKLRCKIALQERIGLDSNPDVLLIGIISRFVEQKGLDVVCNILHGVVNNLHIQFAVLGSGNRSLEDKFLHHMYHNPGKIAVNVGQSEELSHLIEAGSDCFLMPSRYEPCGMNQMYSMLYGALPIVRLTGGLCDTVESYNEATHSGSGFVFYDLNPHSLYNTICWACHTYHNKKNDFVAMQKYAMKKDFSLNKMATKYLTVYDYSREHYAL